MYASHRSPSTRASGGPAPSPRPQRRSPLSMLSRWRLTTSSDHPVGTSNGFGFWHGACGPAACRAGGAIGLVDHAVLSAAGRSPDPHRDAQIGALAALRWQLQVMVEAAGREIDVGPGDMSSAMRRALMLRHNVERAATSVVDLFGRAARAATTDPGRRRRASPRRAAALHPPAPRRTRPRVDRPRTSRRCTRLRSSPAPMRATSCFVLVTAPRRTVSGRCEGVGRRHRHHAG